MSSLSAQSAGDFSPSEVSAYYLARGPKLQQRGREWRGPCPVHKGTGDNFSVNAETGMWYCHSQCGRGGSMFDLEMALTNTDFPPAANEVRRIVGRPSLHQVDHEPEMKWGLPGWSHGYLRQQIEAVEQKQQWKHTAIYLLPVIDSVAVQVCPYEVAHCVDAPLPLLGGHARKRLLHLAPPVFLGLLCQRLQRRIGGLPHTLSCERELIPPDGGLDQFSCFRVAVLGTIDGHQSPLFG
jgi:hypothetical protein